MGKIFTDNIVSSISRQKEKLIYDAIKYATGKDSPHKEYILERIRIISLPGGVEIFEFDGKDLIQFGKCETVVKNDGIQVEFYTVQKYKLLY